MQDIDIIYQDESIVVINKPSGLLSLSGKNPLNFDSVHYRMKKLFPTALMLHRLDFGTSGLMVLALNKDVNRLMTIAFQDRKIGKKYQAVLFGCLKSSEGVIDLPIAKGQFPYQKICHQNGKTAKTEFAVIKTDVSKTYVEFTPFTGRTHQLRVHSQSIGHAILGDDLYQTENSFEMAQRLMLHASYLKFNHPKTQKEMIFEQDANFS